MPRLHVRNFALEAGGNRKEALLFRFFCKDFFGFVIIHRMQGKLRRSFFLHSVCRSEGGERGRQRFHLVPLEKSLQFISLRFHHIRIGSKFQRHVAANRRQVFGQKCLFLIRCEIFFELLARDFRQAFVDAFQGTAVDEELLRRLRADARNARDVVRSVPHQALHINESLWREAVLFQEQLFIVKQKIRHTLARKKHADIFPHELQGIAVARHDEDVHVLPRCFHGERPQDVISFISRLFDQRYAQRGKKLVQHGNLARKLGRRRLARPFVRRKHLIAEGLLPLVKSDGKIVRRIFVQQLLQHIRKAIYRIRVCALRRPQKRQRIKCTVKKAAAVDKDKSFAQQCSPHCKSRRIFSMASRIGSHFFAESIASACPSR